MKTKPLPTDELPDYHRLAARFDAWLPYVQPVTLALLDRLTPPANGDEVLDVACGTGEPGLTLAQRWPTARVLGVDAAPGMVAAAREVRFPEPD